MSRKKRFHGPALFWGRIVKASGNYREIFLEKRYHIVESFILEKEAIKMIRTIFVGPINFSFSLKIGESRSIFDQWMYKMLEFSGMANAS